MAGKTAAVGLFKRYANLKEGKTLIKDAFEFAEEEFKEQGEFGEKNLAHGVRVAERLFDLGFDSVTVAAGLLHDLEETEKRPEKVIVSKMGKEIASIVSEYNKIRQIEDKNIDNTSTNILSTIILAGAKDIRTIFVVFASRIDMLENQPEIGKLSPEGLAKGALEIYAPMCQKLGLYSLQSLLEDSSLKILKPKVYKEISLLIGQPSRERKEAVKRAIQEFSDFLKQADKNVSVQGRAKSIYSIYEKMESQGLKSEGIFDLLGVRVICNSVRECYEILGIVHSKYKNIPNKFSDYISNPKKNKYRSIHTVVLWEGKPLEVQIRTWEMHYECETGLSSHWQYKNYAEDKFFDRKLSWAKQVVDWHRALKGRSIIHSLKMDFGKNRIFVFTPKHQVVVLPEASSPIDFAFAIHTGIGSKCQKAKVDGKIVPLSQKLENGNVVEIITATTIQVKRPWLSIVKSSKARSKIKQRLGIKTSQKTVLIKTKQETLTSDKQTRIARCCNPVPGDEIVGVRTTKRKISIHRAECENVKQAGQEKKINIKWGLAEKDYVVGLTIRARDSPQLLPSILNIIGKEKAQIVSTDTRTDKNKILECEFNIRIKNTMQLAAVIQKLESLSSVFEIKRE